jgi:predicted ATP-dependent endonuclease of OLD family
MQQLQKIYIKNFGPVAEANIDINKVMVFIGPQASGKSTISKSIYLFKSLKDDLIRYIIETVEKENPVANISETTTVFKKIIRAKFVSFWGTTKYLEQFELSYNYNNRKKISFNLDNQGYVKAILSSDFQEKLNTILEQTQNFIIKQKNNNKSFASVAELLAMDSEKKNFYRTIEQECNQLFEDDKLSLYIPAGRSALATLSDPIQKLILTKISDNISANQDTVNPYLLDYTLKAFIERINNLKTSFLSDYDTIIRDKVNFTNESVDYDSLHAATSIFDNILKGRYRYDKDGEKIFLNNSDRFVKLSFASSGQQEVVWILLQIFMLILNKTRTHFFIEEPEAHLFPVAQKDVVELFCLFANLLDNQMLITTHSPYILSALNNFMYAGKLGKTQAAEVGKIINKKTWLKPHQVAAYYVENGVLTNIIDDELQLIKAEMIDQASGLVNQEFNQLFELDLL